ncbi:kinase-like domain-containing protein [Chaetomidium leptoderma]|uniref:Kinase-like domain-containing protein n=1 Tax=Chaetomidium leptoderma TaxID=669021 RepID=A0AAN6ZYN1_9PEZI|nr:kinase-like domain-containing protein [Chaetomidium leptoderma]
MEPPIPVRDSVKQIDTNSWLVGSKHVLRHVQGPREGDCLWESPSDGSYYTFSAAPVPQPDSGPLAPDGHARQIHDAGDESAVFNFGDALIIKIRIATDNTRREPQTLAFLAKQQLSFDIPVVLFYMEDAGKAYLVEPYISGKRLNEAWWDMPEEEKEHVATRVSQVCLDIKVFQSNAMTGSDYNWMNPLQETRDDRVEVVQQQCEELGMDCSSVFVLAHNDLGPTNIIVNGDRIGVIDWEMAGYVPLEWVRTKFAVCGVLCVERVHREPSPVRVERNGEYPVRVEQRLGEMGFPEATAAYKRMHDMREVEWKKNRPWL